MPLHRKEDSLPVECVWSLRRVGRLVRRQLWLVSPGSKHVRRPRLCWTSADW
jgi:hypothetical protein